MKTKRLELRVTQDFLDAIDAARGDVSRTRWVERALEKALGGRSSPGKDEGVMGVPQPSSPPAPSRASRAGKGFVPPRPKGKS